MDDSLLAVNKIQITYVQVSKEAGTPEGSYSLEVQWTAASAGHGPDNFWVWLQLNGNPTLLAGPTTEFTAEAKLSDIRPEETYFVYVTDEETGNPNQKKCLRETLLFQTFSEISCVYDGEAVDISWNKPARELSFVQAETSGPDWTNIPGRYLHGRLSCDRRDVNPAEPFCAYLTPFLNDISSGIRQASGKLYSVPAALKEVDAEPETGKVTAVFTHEYADESALSARLVLLNEDGSELAATTPKAPEMGEAGCTLSGTFSTAFDFDRCWLRVDLCGENTVSILPERGKNLVPLARPSRLHREYGKGTLRLSWDYGASMVHAEFQAAFNRGTASAGPRSEIELPLEKPELLDAPVTLRAVLANGGCKGPAVSFHPFLPGYYPGEDGAVRLCVENWKAAPLSLPLPAGTFSTPLSEALSSGPLKVSAGSEPALTVDTGETLRAGDWTAFLQTLEGAKVTPKGCYFFRRQLPRLASLTGKDALACLCGMGLLSLQADLIPGMILSVTPAAFQLQPNEDFPDCEGFVTGAPSRYEISLRELEGTPVLSMNNCLHQAQPHWTQSVQNPNFPNLHLLGGPMDFFQAGLRAPFARLCYPMRYLAADEPPTLYASDNILMLTGASLTELDEASSAWLEDPTEPIKTPYLQCCGRSLLALEQYVRVNGGLHTAAVGTTLGDLAACLGIEDLFGSGLRLTRATPFGPMPVHLDWFDNAAAAELVLLGGDEIEVKAYAVPIS